MTAAVRGELLAGLASVFRGVTIMADLWHSRIHGAEVAHYRDRHFILHEADRSKAMQANDMTRDIVEMTTPHIVAHGPAFAYSKMVPHFLSAHGCVQTSAAHLVGKVN